MRKMILTPKKDTITLCLPPEWVGRPVVCILETPYDFSDGEEVVSQVSEAALCYYANKYRKPRSQRRERRAIQPRRKRSR